MNKVLFSSNSDDWRTPSSLYNHFMNKGFIDLFPYHSKVDQYNKTYTNSKLFINPPYSHLNSKKFHDYLLMLINNHNLIYLLIPSRTDTKFFHFISQFAHYFIFFKGRLHFNDSKQNAPFPSVLVEIDTLSLFRIPFCISRFCTLEGYVNGRFE